MVNTWHVAREVEAGVHVVAEPVHVASYLIRGRDRAILLDTGLGIGDIRAAVEELTDLDVLVVNSHYHFDHSGGNHLFEDIAIHRDGANQLAEPVPAEIHERYLTYTRNLLESFDVYRELDDRFFHFLTAETTPLPLPEGVSSETWSHMASVPNRLLDDGEILDLGGRRLRVLHTPGHTPDCICLWDEANGLLFAGDTINTGPIYAQLPDSDVRAFAKSTRRLVDELGDDVRRTYFCHFCRYSGDARLIAEIADGFQALADGDVNLRQATDCVSFQVLEAVFDRFSIFVADPEADESTPLLTAGTA